MDLVLPFILTVTGTALGAFILYVLFGTLFRDGLSWRDRIKLKRKQSALTRFDLLLQAGEFEQACNALEAAFFLDHVKSGQKFIELIGQHHFSVLGKILGMAEKFSAHLDNLAILEDLLHARTQLMKSYVEKIGAKEALRQKDRDWAMNEYATQLADIADRLITNRRSIESQIAKLMLALRNIRKQEEITYH